uniref:ras-related protein Rab-24 n=1 Tax=Myxine glutinosa TaxID=7769 RepID=UPI00358E35B5
MNAQRVDVKLVLLGREYSGKTSLVERFVHDRFSYTPYQSTIGNAFVAKRMEAKGKNMTMGIWDTAGSERYEAMTRIYYRGAQAAVVCFALTEDNSFERAKFWVNELLNCEEHCRVYLCATKADLVEDDKMVRKVDLHDMHDYAEEMKAQLFETSSKTGQNVHELFQKIADDCAENLVFTDQTPRGVNVTKDAKKEMAKCCVK